MPSSTHTEGSDAEIYPQLARANLLRMRSQYKQAEDVCLSLLRRYPNNVTANTLLGDICAERDDLDHAIEWYELALDLAPDSTADKQKLAAVKQRKAEREAITTAKQLGLPAKGPRTWVVACALLAFILLVGVIAYTLGRGYLVAAKAAAKPVVDMPVTIPDPMASTKPNANPPELRRSAPAVLNAKAAEDRNLAVSVSAKTTEGARVLDVVRDPRNNDVVLTYFVQDGDDDRALGAHLAAVVLELQPECHKVVLRAVRNGSLGLCADVLRDDVDKTASGEWQESYGRDNNAWVDTVVTNEWRP